jgi:hypothetical protein
MTCSDEVVIKEWQRIQRQIPAQKRKWGEMLCSSVKMIAQKVYLTAVAIIARGVKHAKRFAR